MKSNLTDRMSAQRAIIKAINRLDHAEPLMGLSRDAIDRWASSNRIANDAPELTYVLKAAEALVTLRNMSQQEITLEYRRETLEIKDIERAIQRLSS